MGNISTTADLILKRIHNLVSCLHPGGQVTDGCPCHVNDSVGLMMAGCDLEHKSNQTWSEEIV